MNTPIDVDLQDENGVSLLQHAVTRGNVEEVRRLLENGADPDLQDNEGITALIVAVKQKDIQNIRLLLFYGADVELKDDLNKNSMDYASEVNYPEMMALLQKHI